MDSQFYQLGRCSLPKRPDLAATTAVESIAEVTNLAERGDREAQFLMGSAYHFGMAVERDLEKAVLWYAKAVESGHATAMNNLGVMLAHGHGTDPDIDKARLLFSRAAELGLRAAQDLASDYGARDPHDSQRLEKLRTATLVQAVGMKKDQGIAFLAKHGLISNPADSTERDYNELKQYHFRADGVALGVDVSGRITNVEGHAKGSRNSEQFRGDIPLGLTWNTTLKGALEALGEPDDRGYVKNDGAYGLAYRIGNVSFAAMFSNEGDYKLKVWRVHEKWATR